MLCAQWSAEWPAGLKQAVIKHYGDHYGGVRPGLSLVGSRTFASHSDIESFGVFTDWPHQPRLLCSLKVTLSDFPSAAAFNNTSATSAPPSAIIAQGRSHAPVEPFAVVALTTLPHWAGYSSLCQRQRDKCYNYVNSVQPECFSRWNIANWTAFWRILSAPRSWMISPSKLRVHIFTHCFYHIAPLCVCLSMHMCIILKEWVPGAAFGFAQALLLLPGLKDLTGALRPNWTVCVVLSGLKD